jgi:hypothetical protein
MPPLIDNLAPTTVRPYKDIMELMAKITDLSPCKTIDTSKALR